MRFLSLFALTIVSLVSGIMAQLIFGQSADYEINTTDHVVASQEGPANRPENTSSISEDTSVPIVRVVDPSWCSVVRTGEIIVNGTSSDNGTGVQIVEVRVDKNKYSTAVPENLTDWSSWSISININDTQPHRILARATDNSGNQNWEDITINSPLGMGNFPPETVPVKDKKNRFAFVEPTFTSAAYSANHFYAFYDKYEASTADGEKVTADLDMLTASVPLEPAREYFLNFTQHVKEFAPNATVSIIRDEDVHHGYIFRPDGSNAYDTLFLLHNEYVSDEEYNNFKRFVSNGGTIVFLDGNMLYAQVRYDPKMCTVTLVKGHDWEVDSKAAVKSDHEAYFDEKKEWVGSNFLYGDIAAPVRFMDNPFNYTHFEENYVNNPNATILFDYAAQIPQEILNDNQQAVGSKIATYELSYGKGKVMVMGLYTQNLAGNEKFLKFFDHIVSPRAMGQSYRFDDAAGNDYVAYWCMNTGKISKIERDEQSNGLILTLERSDQKEDKLTFTLPQSLVGGGDPRIYNFTTLVNGKEVSYNRTADDVETGFEIPLTAEATKVQISATPSDTNHSNKSQEEPSQKGSTVKSSNESVISASGLSKTTNVEIPEGAYSVTNTEFYKPETINIPRGTTATWTNNDVELHTVTSGNLDTGGPTGTLFDSGPLPSGKTYMHTFSDKGSFDYFCTLHPFMTGKVVVK